MGRGNANHIVQKQLGKHFPSRAVGALYNYVIVPAIWPDNAQVTSSRKKKKFHQVPIFTKIYQWSTARRRQLLIQTYESPGFLPGLLYKSYILLSLSASVSLVLTSESLVALLLHNYSFKIMESHFEKKTSSRKITEIILVVFCFPEVRSRQKHSSRNLF